MTVGERLPTLLTVEEAGALLRIGRTKAYAMTMEWRETGGRSGLPVIDLGHVLRVPRRALEELIGAELTDGESADWVGETGEVPAPTDALEQQTIKSPEGTPPDRPATISRVRRRPHQGTDQLDLFDSRPETG